MTNSTQKTAAALATGFLALACTIEETSCIAEGAMVTTPTGLVGIESLSVGAVVLSMDPATGEHSSSAIVRVVSAERECVAIHFGESTLVCTPDHPLYDPAEGAFAPASEWVEGKRGELLDGDRKRVRVDRVDLDAGVRRVFDLTVEHPLHNFLVEHVLVHNKTTVDTAPATAGLTTIGSSGESPDTDASSTGGSSTGGSSTGGSSSEGASTGDSSTGRSDTDSDSSSSSGSESTSGSTSTSSASGSSSG